MFHNKAAIGQLVRVLIGEVILTAAMLGVYAILDRFTPAVAWGALLGSIIALGNFLALSITVSRAADRAEKTGDAARATMSVRASAPVRMLVMAGLYILLLRTKRFDPVASVLPLLFVQVSITLTEYFRKDKDGEDQK